MRIGKPQRIPYSEDEMLWLEANRMMIISDYHRDFCARFERTDVTSKHLHALRKRKGWKVGRAPGRFVGRHLLYSPAEIAWLQANITREPEEYHRAFCALFDRTDVSMKQLVTLRKNEGWLTGRSGRFAEGAVPANKGKKMPYNENSARTWFRKGQIPHNTKEAGSEYVDSQSGYVWISVEETNPRTGFERRYVQKHRLLWERANGPVPEDMVLKCLGDDKTNCDPSNWDLIPRSLIPVLNFKSGLAYDKAPAELKPTIMAVAKLEHRIKNRSKS